jgi:Capsule assembly protein Wzi
MKNFHLFILLFSIFIFDSFISAQTVYEPAGNDIYSFLSLLSQKGIIEFNDQVKPVPRKYIAQKLLEINSKSDQLTSLEKEEALFYNKEFGFEMGGSQPFLNYLGNDQFGRLRLFSYSDSLFKLNISPILGMSLGKNAGSKYTHTWSGIGLYGYIGNRIGFSFNYRDNSETGATVDMTKQFTPVTGVIIARSSPDNIQYSETHAIIATDWSWGEASIGKDFMEWGYGESGKLVLSDKAPSFPFIRLDLRLTGWLRFNYFHAWLNSDVVDSASSYPTYINSDPNQSTREVFKNKYLASHTIIVTPVNGLDISLGESIIYSDKLEIGYLIPINFFRLMDHYLSSANNNVGGNAQFFLGVSSRNHLKNTHLYGTWFIDELTIEGLFDKMKQRNQFGFTIGGSFTDLPVENLTAVIEYTKIYPFVYSHYIPTQLYTNSSYVMGDWMGNNADRIYASLNYRFLRGLQGTIWGQYIRKGESGTPEEQYSQPQPPFLFGLRTNYTYLGIDLKYEITHELFVRSTFQNLLTSKEITKGTFNDVTGRQFLFMVYYGI